MNNEFLLDLVGTLQQNQTRKQLNDDIKQIEKKINMLRITGTFAKGDTRKSLNAYINQLSGQLSTLKLKAKIDNRNLKREMDSALKAVKFKDIDVLNIDENKTRLKVKKVIADVKSYAEKMPVTVNFQLKKEKLDNDLTTYLNRNTKISESTVLLKEADKVRDLIGAINDKKSLREATDAFALYKSEVSSIGFNSRSTSDKIKSMIGHVTKLGSVLGAASFAMDSFKKSLGTLKGIDSILTEISKTSDLTAQQLEKLGNTPFKSASKYGKTASDYLIGIQEMARSGFYGDKGTAMAEKSLLAQAAGDMSADLANNYILATNAAYKYNGEAEKLNAVLDGQNSITNKNSIAMADMAAAMSDAGTVASSYRVSIEDLSAMIGTIEAVTKSGGSEVGNAIKAILINLQNITSDKIVDTLNAANASMTEFVNGSQRLRNPIEILRDLAKTFNQLEEDDALRAEILTNIGGKYQAAKLAALLQNMDMFDKMLVDYSEGSGSAMEEAMKSANNWEGSLNKVQNSWDNFVSVLVNKNTVINGLSFFDRLIQGATTLTDTVGEIPVVFTALQSAMTAMNKNYGITQIWDKEQEKFSLEGNLLGIDFSNIKNMKNHFNEAEEAIFQWNDKLANGKANLNSFNSDLVKNNAQFKDYLSTCKGAPASLEGYKSYLKSIGVQTDTLRLQTILLNSAISIGIGFAIQAAVSGISYLAKKHEEAAHAFENAVSEYDSAKSSLESVNSELEKQNKRIKELLSKDKLTYAEQGELEKLQAITKELMLQQDIEKRRTAKAPKDVADEAVDAYKKKYKKYDLSESGLKDKFDYSEFSGMSAMSSGEDDITGNIVTYVRAKELLEKSQQDYDKTVQDFNNALKDGEDTARFENDIKWLENDIQQNINLVDDMSRILDDNISDLQEKQSALQEEYNKAVEKKEKGTERLTSSEQDIISAYESIYDTIRMIYEYTNQNDWNDMEIAGIFNTEGIEKTKEELAAMVESGELTPEIIESYENLNRAVQNSELFLKNGQTAAQAFCNEIYGCVEASEAVVKNADVSSAIPAFDPAAFSDTMGKFSEITSAYEKFADKIKNEEKLVFDISDIESMREALVEMSGETPQFGVTAEQFDEFESIVTSGTASLEEMQDAFDNLSTEYINAGGILDGLSASNRDMIVSQLELKGITNASAIATEELAQGFDDVRNSGSSLDAILNGDSNALDNVSFSSQEAGYAVAQYMLAKITANGIVLSTDGDIQNLIALMSYLGGATSALQTYAAMKNGQYTNGKEINKIGNSGDYYRDKMQDQIKADVDATKAKNGLANATANLNDVRKAGNSGGGSKEKEEETDIMAELNSEMDEYQSKLEAVKDARETYDKYGKITVDQAQKVVDADFKLLAAYGDEEAALESLGQAKLNEMQIQLARNAVDTINNITSEAEATEYLAGANEHLVGTSLNATEAMLQQAVAAAKLRGAMQGQAADTILKGYQNGAMMLGQVDFGFQIPTESSSKSKESKEEKEKDYSKTLDWVERLLNRLSKATEKLRDSADKFVSWWRKNNALNRAIKANRKEISGNEDAYYYYMKKANKVGLSKKYKKLVQDGDIRIQDIKDEGLADKIEKYQEW